MAAKNEGFTHALLDEVERNIDQMSDLSRALTRAAASAWTQGMRTTLDALSAALDEGAGPKQPVARNAREQVERLGRGVREFARRASVGYGAALRAGSSRYLEEVERPVAKQRSNTPKARPKRVGRNAKK
jgi:hypothetical protein